MTPTFAIATVEEVWLRGRLSERRLSWGSAVETDGSLSATDSRDEQLAAAASAAVDAIRTLVTTEERIRLIGEATPGAVRSTIIATRGERSVVTGPQFFSRDLALLRSTDCEIVAPVPERQLPLLWKNGSGSVLLHEAVGHPLEHEQDPLPLPPWLSINVALEMRRASFRDVPLVRMKEVAARQQNAPFALPSERIDVLLVDSGAYDPVNETVTLRIAAANLVNGEEALPLPPFEFSAPRDAILRSLAGATGEPERYPGVICSREGQELVVDSYAPLLLTEHG